MGLKTKIEIIKTISYSTIEEAAQQYRDLIIGLNDDFETKFPGFKLFPEYMKIQEPTKQDLQEVLERQ